jgi:hypothetical protein
MGHPFAAVLNCDCAQRTFHLDESWASFCSTEGCGWQAGLGTCGFEG